MADLTHLRTLLGELGQRIGLDDLEPDEDGHTMLAFDDVLVSFELDDSGDLLLYSHLGTADPENDAAALCRAMLDANLFWRDTSGATLAREDINGGFVLQQRRTVQDMDINAFEDLLKGFVDTAEDWMSRIEEPAANVDRKVETTPPLGSGPLPHV